MSDDASGRRSQHPFEPLNSSERKGASAFAEKRGFLENKGSGSRPIVPVPDDAPPLNYKHPKYGEPSMTWAYRNRHGKLLGFTARWDYTDVNGKPAKHCGPISYCNLDSGQAGWRAKALSQPRTLYNQSQLYERDSAEVLVVEGEKTAGRCRKAFSKLGGDYVARRIRGCRQNKLDVGG